MVVLTRPAEWAVLIYSSATPNIQDMAVASLREVAEACHEDSVLVGAQLGRPGRVDRFQPGAPEERLPAADMSDPACLEDFLRWGMRELPARHYLVVLGGHSAGFVGAITDAAQRRLMPLPQLAAALDQSGLHPDVLVFNSCLMAQAEVAFELYPRADYLVASEGEELAQGIPLGTVVEGLPGLHDGELAARLVVESCAGAPDRTPTMTALDLSRMPELADSLDRLGRRILEAPESLAFLRQAVEKAPSFWNRGRPLSDYRDLGTVLAAWARDERLPRALRETSTEAIQAARALVRAHHSNREELGLSLYLPCAALPDGLAEKVEPAYRALELSRRTAWDEAVELLRSQEP